MRILSFDVGLKNLAWCLYDATPEPRILKWDVVDVTSQAGDLAEQFARTLSAHEDLLDFDGIETRPFRVIVEKQPGRSGQTINAQTMLQTFYLLRGKLDREAAGLPSVDCVDLFCAKYRFAGEQALKGRKQYAARKAAAVERALVHPAVRGTPWEEWLTGLAKKDDAADALLNAIVYAERTPVKTKRVVGRRRKAGDTSAYTAANCKMALKNLLYPRKKADRTGALERLPAAVDGVPALKAAVHTMFGGLNEALQGLGLLNTGVYPSDDLREASPQAPSVTATPTKAPKKPRVPKAPKKTRAAAPKGPRAIKGDRSKKASE